MDFGYQDINICIPLSGVADPSAPPETPGGIVPNRRVSTRSGFPSRPWEASSKPVHGQHLGLCHQICSASANNDHLHLGVLANITGIWGPGTENPKCTSGSRLKSLWMSSLIKGQGRPMFFCLLLPTSTPNSYNPKTPSAAGVYSAPDLSRDPC